MVLRALVKDLPLQKVVVGQLWERLISATIKQLLKLLPQISGMAGNSSSRCSMNKQRSQEQRKRLLKQKVMVLRVVNRIDEVLQDKWLNT